ncbi:hypothetical protein PENSPDRAFT_30695 [Peniophora sp. CONT]|nr:hypothetical protein PENSPDRAFT_30695 [Peniophora sp. CONT]
MVYPPPGVPMQPYAAYPAQPYYATPGAFIPAMPPAAPPAAPNRRAGEKYDLVFKFGGGMSYGPALKPAHLHALGSHLEVNPLLAPVTDADATTRKHIIWNMLFVSSDARLSTDGPNRSWSTGRDEPVTFPRVTLLRLISTTFPWSIDVHAHNPESGVSCGDVIDALSAFLQQHSPRADYEAVTGEYRRALKDAYHHNRSRAHGVPGGRLGEGMRRVDWLRDAVIFGGIRVNDTMVFERSDGAPMPGVLEVICKEQADLLHADDEEMRGRAGRTRSNSRIRSQYSSRHASRSRPVTPM